MAAKNRADVAEEQRVNESLRYTTEDDGQGMTIYRHVLGPLVCPAPKQDKTYKIVYYTTVAGVTADDAVELGLYHRLDGPAFINTRSDGYETESWWRNGVQHREDGPAFSAFELDRDPFQRGWWFDGKLHRQDGPACIERFIEGCVQKCWYRRGELHREDGPAVVWSWPDGSSEHEWWLDGCGVSHQEFQAWSQRHGSRPALPPAVS